MLDSGRILPGWDVIWARLPIEVKGVANFKHRHIVLDVNLLVVEQRCALAHAIVHIERGSDPRDTAGYRREVDLQWP